MKNYSQGEEQKYILDVLGVYEGQPAYGEKRPRLLEIGAYHATELSNSRALIELGWEAVLFEPSPGPLKGLVQEYGDNPRVEVVGCCIRPVEGITHLRVTDDAVTAFADNAAHLETWKNHGFYGTMTTWAVSVEDVFCTFGPFDFVSIDTEGTSVDLFRSMLCLDRQTVRPLCVVVEHNNRWDELRPMAEAAGYEGVFRNGENLVLKWKGKP